MPITPEASTDTEHELEHLEAIIARGLAAYDKRNKLIVHMVDMGYSKADIARRLNRVRERVGVEPLTPAAITATCKRISVPEAV